MTAAAVASVAVVGSLLSGPAVSAAPTGSVPKAAPAAARMVHKRVTAYPEPYAIVVTYKYPRGSHARTVGLIYASKDTRSRRAHYARYSYVTPRGVRHVSGWRRHSGPHSGREWRGVSWGDVGADTRRVKRNSTVCTQFKGSQRWACVRVK